jgi:hypothetical protein
MRRSGEGLAGCCWRSGFSGYCGRKLLSLARRRGAAEWARENHEFSEQHAWRLVNQSGGRQRYMPIRRMDGIVLTRAIMRRDPRSAF